MNETVNKFLSAGDKCTSEIHSMVYKFFNKKRLRVVVLKMKLNKINN